MAAQGVDQARRRVGGRVRRGGSAYALHVSAAPCSVLAERAGDDLAATAPAADRFLLLEQPGPWRDRNAVTHSDLDVGLARELLAYADEAGVKVHLIRRTARRMRLERRTCFLAGTARDDPWVERHELSDPAEVLGLDLTSRHPEKEWREPVYAVCTHGKRDPCCARRGRPLARALKAARPAQTWEIGHIGGHRYAATFLAFPHGLTFGRVPAAAGARIVAGLEAGEIVLEHLRGRAGDPWAVQAADVLVRRALGLRGIDDLVVEAAEGTTVRLRARGAPWVATIRRTIAGERPLSCGAEAEPVAAFDLAGLVARDRAA
jgi:hypothetical protein